MRLSTRRLELVAATPALIASDLADARSLTTALSATVPADWPPGEIDRAALEFFAARYAEEGEAAIGWYHWYAIVRAAPATLVAGAGYYGPPKEGRVEIGYSVVASAQRRGYATEIVEALVAHAFACGAHEVVAHTMETNAASTRVLARCGFVREGSSPTDPTIVRHIRRRGRDGA
ncbi:MAG: GNAT family N-acetyltransferase [Myxococcales bacterium]|nr:GNAT family N-acetyltransferase [Myxococcales bacterium]